MKAHHIFSIPCGDASRGLWPEAGRFVADGFGTRQVGVGHRRVIVQEEIARIIIYKGRVRLPVEY